MEKYELILSLLVISGTVLGTAVSSTVSETELLKPKPQFFAEINIQINNFTHGEKIIVSNIGNLQAKNSVIIIGASKSLTLTNNSCLEGIIISENKNFVKIGLSKFSTNIQCIIEFFDSPRNNINTLVVTGDDSNGYQHNFEDDDLKPISIPLFGRIPFEFIFIIISYVAAAISFWYLIRRRIQRKKISEINIQKENQLKKEQDDIKQKLEIEMSKSGSINSKILQNRIELAEHLNKIRNEIKATKIIQNYPNNVTIVNKFFEKWNTFEKILFMLGSTLESKIDHRKTIDILHELKNKELISHNLFSNLENLVDYRNSLVHNTIKLDSSSLENYVNKLNDAITKLRLVKPSPEFIVKIPQGSSVPGCEESHSCYVPYELKIKEGQIVTWVNDDSAAHTITSGTIPDGHSGLFDSSLIMSGSTFSWKSKKKGTYPYFCMVHPWQTGIIVVE